MTTRAVKQKPLKGAELTDTPSNRLKPCALDEHYFQVALEYPKMTQRECLQKAMELAGREGIATKQQANTIHDRLRDRINIEATKIANDIKYLSVSRLRDILVRDELDNLLLGAIQTGTKDLFPNVSVKKTQTIDDINSEISNLLKKTAEAEGKTVDQVVKEMLH